jgi:hypothetical protein
MKRLAIILAVTLLALVTVTPVLAVSLGVSPSHVEIEVPGDGIALADVQVHYFSGDVQVSLVDIPLQVEPELVHVDALVEPEDVQLTIYGDESLGSQVYEGYIRFLGLSGETVAVAVKIKATVTNIVEDQPLPEPIAEETATPANEENQEPASATSQGPPPAGEVAETNWLEGIEGLSTNLVIIIAAAVVFLGLVILAISLVARRRRRYY